MKLTITGSIILGSKDISLLRNASPEEAAATLFASGTRIKVIIEGEQPVTKPKAAKSSAANSEV